jgi:hypothetical protein
MTLTKEMGTPTTNDADQEPHHKGKTDPDPYQSEKLGQDLHRGQKQNPDPHQKVKIQELWRLKWSHRGP